jgi:hypothetical protein
MTASNWINHIRKFAKDNNITYSCALSNPECSKSYQAIKNKKVETKKETQVTNKPKDDIKIRATPIKQTTDEELIENWDDPYLGYIVYNTDLGRKFENLISKKKQVIDVYLLALTKSINEKIIKRWGVDILMQGINNIANYLEAENYNILYGVEKNLPIKKIVGDKVYKMITDANNKKIGPKIEPKIETKPLKKADPYKWVIEVETPYKQQFPFDFTFSRDFNWKMEKTPKGYINRFKNKRDYETAEDITMYNQDYKNRNWYKWIYRGKVE